ncbi:DeoR/GlpR family DNA-binding transcription regulator [Clostridium lacusfryxellense]|uniref:DeoR/GlpR family DNA-binding transcription regulator n=1 Tax=Clostridium lacusfryxellense TaxID=205328 RepID=UPI001C0D3323|nr:DeoR/GlpR family DNA-binding transcription regulator [Clostridium lacusfryxellense]MBU3114000.1 DeoR/GlpR family DNA-binding transcription regulator [Clostridium lacusfryxellense]
MNERHIKLIEIVSQYGKIEVNELSKLLGISQVTTRKDLEYLSRKGILLRERGYALLKNKDDINYHMAFHYEEKQKIAKAAAELVEDRETIIVESGSTCAMFVEQLVSIRKGITIITNSSYIANFIKDNDNVEIILLGGNYQKHTQSMVGPMTKECVKKLKVDKIFVGTDGFSKEIGFTGVELIRSDTVRAMTARANHTYILAESAKLEHASATPYLRTEDVYKVITDKKISPEIRSFLESKQVKLELV